MKMHIIFNILVQLFILFTAVNLYFDTLNVRLVISMILTGIVFVPSVIEFFLGVKFKSIIHYVVSLVCLLIFTILIAI